MRHESLGLKEFQRAFATEQACLDHLFKLRWPDGFRCPRCRHSHYYYHRTRRLFQCVECKYQASVTAGTVFHKTRTPLVNWFWMIFVMARQKSGVSMLGIQGMLGMPSYKTVWTMAHKIRKAMADSDSSHQLAGIVERSEFTLQGRSRRPKGRQARILVTVGKRSDESRFAVMRHVSSASNTLRSSKPGATPGRPKGDNRGSEAESDRQDQVVERALEATTAASTPLMRLGWVRVLASNFRGNIRGVHHGVSAKHLHRFLAEFTYRFNRRLWASELFNRTVKACLSASTVSFEELTI